VVTSLHKRTGPISKFGTIDSKQKRGSNVYLKKVLGAVAAVVLGVSTAAAQEKSVSFMLDWTPGPMHGSVYWADKQKIYDKYGLKVEILSPSDTTVPLKLVATGNVDLAISYATEAILARKEGVDVTMVGSVIPRPLIAMMAPASAGIKDMRDLKGRKVGYSGIPTYLALIQTMIANSGLKEDEVEIVNVGFNLVPAVLSGSVDAIGDGFINGQAVQIEQQTGAKPFIKRADELGIPTYDENVIVADPKRLASDPDYQARVKAFLAAFYEGVDEANKNVPEVTALMEEVTDRDADYLRASVPLSLELMLPDSGNLGCISNERYKKFSAWMAEKALISEAPDLNSLIDNSYLSAPCE
jgi:putative hydroxymethylpyrimidine transport system substrate-binding protein